jgi:hypothetical protein
MYDAWKIIGGIIIFLVLITGPIWYDMASGKTDYKPDPKIITTEKQCVMPTEYMRAVHMDLLNEWRNAVVREGRRTHISHDGKKYNMSLSNTCMSCHSNKSEFCDVCHNYSAVGQPNCWNCHIDPEEIK